MRKKCNWKNASLSSAVPSCLKTRTWILERCLNQSDLKLAVFESFIFFGAREHQKVEAHSHDSIFLCFSFSSSIANSRFLFFSAFLIRKHYTWKNSRPASMVKMPCLLKTQNLQAVMMITFYWALKFTTSISLNYPLKEWYCFNELDVILSAKEESTFKGWISCPRWNRWKLVGREFKSNTFWLDIFCAKCEHTTSCSAHYFWATSGRRGHLYKVGVFMFLVLAVGEP